MPVKDFIINKRLGVVMGTGHPVSPADESTGGPGRAAGGTDPKRGAASPEIGSNRPGAISNFARKNGTLPRAEAAPVRHLRSLDGKAACGSAERHLTAYRELVTCWACLTALDGKQTLATYQKYLEQVASAHRVKVR